MARVRITKDADVRLSPSDTQRIRVGDEFEIDELAHYAVRTPAGTVWIPGTILERIGTPAEGIEPVAPAGPVAVESRPGAEIVTYKGECFKGDPLQVNTDFLENIKQLEEWALKLRLEVYITSSLRRKNARISGAIVPPARRSNHLVGHAIDMNLIHAGRFYNSQKLKKSQHGLLPTAIKQFIDKIRGHSNLRWGGDFAKSDPVHIDDNLSRQEPDLWEQKFIALYGT